MLYSYATSRGARAVLVEGKSWTAALALRTFPQVNVGPVGSILMLTAGACTEQDIDLLQVIRAGQIGRTENLLTISV
jgi:hypothetical protein